MENNRMLHFFIDKCIGCPIPSHLEPSGIQCSIRNKRYNGVSVYNTMEEGQTSCLECHMCTLVHLHGHTLL